MSKKKDSKDNPKSAKYNWNEGDIEIKQPKEEEDSTEENTEQPQYTDEELAELERYQQQQLNQRKERGK